MVFKTESWYLDLMCWANLPRCTDAAKWQPYEGSHEEITVKVKCLNDCTLGLNHFPEEGVSHSHNPQKCQQEAVKLLNHEIVKLNLIAYK